MDAEPILRGRESVFLPRILATAAVASFPHPLFAVCATPTRGVSQGHHHRIERLARSIWRPSLLRSKNTFQSFTDRGVLRYADAVKILIAGAGRISTTAQPPSMTDCCSTDASPKHRPGVIPDLANTAAPVFSRWQTPKPPQRLLCL